MIKEITTKVLANTNFIVMKENKDNEVLAGVFMSYT